MEIAIIIPIYNVEKYLEQCLQSVAEQSVPFDEVILVNDGSTDNSLQICEKYVSNYGYFKLINQYNKGLSAARNVGVRYADCEYVMFLDSDDYLSVNTVETLKHELKTAKYDVVYFDSNIYCEEGWEPKRNIYDRSGAGIDRIRMTGREYFYECYPGNYVVQACMAIYNKNILVKKQIRFPEGLYFEDNYFSFIVLNRVQKVMHISEKLYYRRYRAGSITTGNYSEKKFRDHIEIGLLIWEEIRQIQLDILLERRDLFLQFINDYFDMVLRKQRIFLEQKIPMCENTKGLLEKMVFQYLRFLNMLNVHNSREISLLNKILGSFDKLLLCSIGDRKQIKRMAYDIADRQKVLYRDLLCELPLSDMSYKVGIYGMGKHTEGLLTLYGKLIGKINCELVFLDSYQDNAVYKGSSIINYQKIDKSIHLVIVSSFLYEKEMHRNIRSINESMPIHTFYNNLKGDAFSNYEVFLKYCGR